MEYPKIAEMGAYNSVEGAPGMRDVVVGWCDRQWPAILVDKGQSNLQMCSVCATVGDRGTPCNANQQTGGKVSRSIPLMGNGVERNVECRSSRTKQAMQL